jgi:hypothetical protein
MAIRSQKVICQDAQGIEHSVDVTAESLCEAVAQAWRSLGENEWNAEGGRRPSIFVVKVKQPEIEHRVPDQGLRNLARGSAEEPSRNGVEESFAKDSRALDFIQSVASESRTSFQ